MLVLWDGVLHKNASTPFLAIGAAYLESKQKIVIPHLNSILMAIKRSVVTANCTVKTDLLSSAQTVPKNGT